jgi:hypothetical protein
MKRYLIFAGLGPFLGGFLLLVATTIMSGYWTETNAGEVAKLFVVFAKTLQYSYLFGVVPCLMIGAVDDILFHVRLYGSRGPDSGATQFVLYGLVGFIPGTLSSWWAHQVETPVAA